ncbi:MAG TPA: TetR/AcrR family transcriptional regulator [Pseudonocardiaceae bacterium]|jgi:AcrR family transcriptional regulator|nr:TetR/AcrR family transcriptional regulator [Pseudonocardiaceae bacterium]
MPTTQEPVTRPDRRVRRSRAALLAAAVRLVSDCGTTAVPVTDLAEAADVSRQLVYLQFGDRDALLVAAATELVQTEVLPGNGNRPSALAMARHFAAHRRFYRAMLTGSCAFAMTRSLSALFTSFNAEAVRTVFGDLDAEVAGDLAEFLAGGTGAVLNAWLIDGADPLDPEELATRLLRVWQLVLATRSQR